jgi:hypothetical protein
MQRNYYASQSPRGFANEINVYAFPDRRSRDRWVDQHENDGDVRSAYCGANKINARRAREIVGYRGDAITESFNRMIKMEEARH